MDEHDGNKSSDSNNGVSDSEDESYCVSNGVEESEQESYTDNEEVNEHE